MASTLPSPPASRTSSPQRTSSDTHAQDSIQRLDSLLEQYLELLDEYTSLREKLSSTFADGFLSLAHAQRTSNLGPGRRYGQDGYDGRMKASKRITFDPRLDGKDTELPSSKAAGSVENKITHGDESSLRVYDFRQHLRSNSCVETEKPLLQESESSEPGHAQLEKMESHKSDTSKDANPTRTKPKVDPAYRDPVTWFGILVPPHLRKAQHSFSLSVEDLIPSLVSTTQLLQNLESRIQTLRRDLGTNVDPAQYKTPSMAVRPGLEVSDL